MADKAATPKRDLGADYEAALKLRAFVQPLLTAPDVLEAALAAEAQMAATAKAVDGLTKQKAVLEGEIVSLTAKTTEARDESDRLIREAHQRTAVAQQQALKAEQATGERLATLSTDARQQELKHEAEHAKAKADREREIATLDGQLARLTAQKDALRKQLE